jgi:biotin carboxyl carrier protein
MAKKNLGGSKGAKIEAAIPGKIVELKVGEGDEVVDQQCILVLESMKMRNEILSPISGIIESVAVCEGDQVKSKQLLMKIKAKK